MQKAVVIVLYALTFVTAALAQDSTPDKLEAARREGTLLWYTGINLADARSLTELFQQRYPFVNVQIHRASGTQIVSKIILREECREATIRCCLVRCTARLEAARRAATIPVARGRRL